MNCIVYVHIWAKYYITIIRTILRVDQTPNLRDIHIHTRKPKYYFIVPFTLLGNNTAGHQTACTYVYRTTSEYNCMVCFYIC